MSLWDMLDQDIQDYIIEIRDENLNKLRKRKFGIGFFGFHHIKFFGTFHIFDRTKNYIKIEHPKVTIFRTKYNQLNHPHIRLKIHTDDNGFEYFKMNKYNERKIDKCIEYNIDMKICAGISYSFKESDVYPYVWRVYADSYQLMETYKPSKVYIIND